jgi:alkylhydroperoxidase family enzyme
VKPRWLDRRIAAPGPYLTLCLTEQEYDAAMKTLGVKHYGSWISPQANATAHHLNNADGNLCAVICLSGHEKRAPVEVAGLLVHEAVHVWQEYCDFYGEDNPGREQEAYAVQSIAQELMAEFARRISPR